MQDNDTRRVISVQEEIALRRICHSIQSLDPIKDHAGTVQRAVAQKLRLFCDRVIMEYPMSYMRRSGPVRGRIDIVAMIDGVRVAIEIDARKPREASVQKLLCFNGVRIVATRGVSGVAPEGIDAFVAVPVRSAQ